MLAIQSVTLNYAPMLHGVETMPIVGWVISSDKKNVEQTHWQLQLSDDGTFNSIIFDSGVIASNESQNITLREIELNDSTRYYVRVKISDNQGQSSEWSHAVQFITGLSGSKWQAEFITAEGAEDQANSKGTLLRDTFTITDADEIVSVIVHASALGLYKLYVNGQKVGNDELAPGWTSYYHNLLYQTYDLTNLITQGDNAIAASVGVGWYKGDMSFNRYRNYYGDRTAFICQIVINYKDGRQVMYGTDDTWLSTDSPVLFSEIYDGEIYDARLELPSWNTVDCDLSNWREVTIVCQERKILRAQGTSTVQAIETLSPQALITTPQGDLVIDFGQNLTGWVEFRVCGKAGERVVLRHFEVLDANGNVYLDNLRSAKQRVEYILNSEDIQTYHPNFTFQGFRYISVESWPGDIVLDNIKAVVVHSHMIRTGEFYCSNPDLNQLHHNILWGLKGNFVDVPTDCPQRDERLGWTGDAQIFCRTASYLMQTRNFFAKWLVDLHYDQTRDGGVPHVVPDILTGRCDNDRFLSNGCTHSAAAWADAAVINPWTLYLMYGDKETLRNQYSSMKAWIDFMRAHSVDNKWSYKLQFGDWVALDAKEGSYFGATPSDLICMAYFSWSTLLFAKVAKVLGNEDDFETYHALYLDIVNSFQLEFFTPTGRLAVRTQTAHILALHFELVPEQFRERTVSTLVELLAEHDGHLVTGFVGTPYFCQVLSDNGRAKEAWQLLLKDDFPSWLYQVKAGATTIWEHWDGIKPDGSMWSPDMNSFNHYAYGAVGEWLYRAVAGIDVDEAQPGFKHTRIQPVIGGDLEWVNARYCSGYGDIVVNWKVKTSGNKQRDVVLSIMIPHNTHATIILPAESRLINTDNIYFDAVNNSFQATIGSGEYCFEYRL